MRTSTGLRWWTSPDSTASLASNDAVPSWVRQCLRLHTYSTYILIIQPYIHTYLHTHTYRSRGELWDARRADILPLHAVRGRVLPEGWHLPARHGPAESQHVGQVGLGYRKIEPVNCMYVCMYVSESMREIRRCGSSRSSYLITCSAAWSKVTPPYIHSFTCAYIHRIRHLLSQARRRCPRVTLTQLYSWKIPRKMFAEKSKR